MGEIWVRSPSIARGYWGVEDPSFGASIDGESGYLRTGDEGFFREENCTSAAAARTLSY